MSNKVETECNVKLGIDLGNGYTNYLSKVFKTRIRTGELLNIGTKRENVHQIEMDGTKFIVGDGEMITGEYKFKDMRYKLCLLTAIADANKRLKVIKAKITVGLPLLDYSRLKDELIEEIMEWGEQTLIVDGRDVSITIVHVDVFVESALPILNNDTSNILTIDIGSGTVNVAEWDNLSPINYDTLPQSFYKMYGDMATYLNGKTGGSFNIEDVEQIIRSGKTKTFVKQVQIDISDIYIILEDFVGGCASYIKQKFNTGQVDHIQILGGGAVPTMKYWLKHFPEAELIADSQMVNAKMFDTVANL